MFFSIAPQKDVSGFEKEMIVFPCPFLPVETLNVAVWTQRTNQMIDKIEGIVDIDTDKQEKIDFFPIKTIRDIKTNQIKKLWLGSKEIILNYSNNKEKYFVLTLKAYNNQEEVLDAITISLPILF